MRYRIVVPNDYGSEEASVALVEAFPGLEGEGLVEEAFIDLHSQWKGLKLISGTDYGGIFEATQPKPAKLRTPLWIHPIA